MTLIVCLTPEETSLLFALLTSLENSWRREARLTCVSAVRLISLWRVHVILRGCIYKESMLIRSRRGQHSFLESSCQGRMPARCQLSPYAGVVREQSWFLLGPPPTTTISWYSSQHSDSASHISLWSLVLHRKAGDPAKGSSSGHLLFLGKELEAFPPTRQKRLFPNQIPKLSVACLNENLTQASVKANFHSQIFIGSEGNSKGGREGNDQMLWQLF